MLVEVNKPHNFLLVCLVFSDDEKFYFFIQVTDESINICQLTMPLFNEMLVLNNTAMKDILTRNELFVQA